MAAARRLGTQMLCEELAGTSPLLFAGTVATWVACSPYTSTNNTFIRFERKSTFDAVRVSFENRKPK